MFQWKRVTETEFTWTVPKDLPYLKGHFPGNPILPGVATIEATIVAIQSITSTRVKGLKRSKFLGFVAPGNEVKLQLERTAGSWRAAWSVGSEKKAELWFECE